MFFLKKPLWFISLSLAVHLLCGQASEILQIKGFIADGAQRPITGVHCYLKNNDHFGSVTDTLGFFQLSAPGTTSYDTLVLSNLGFETKEIPLSAIKNDDTLYFLLKQKSMLLNEIEVFADGYDLKGIYLKALENLAKNYPNKPHELKGFYRKIGTESNRYTKLEEAVITVNDYTYKRALDDIRISTSNFRESKEWGQVDTFYVNTMDKAHTKTSAILGQSPNPINRTLQNRLRYMISNDEPDRTISKYIDDYYGFRLMDIDIVGNDTIYQIAWTFDPVPPVRTPSGKNYMKINMTDFAIIEMQYGGVLDYQYFIEFRKIGTKYYPTHIKESIIRFINQEMRDNELDIREIWFDEINTGKFKKIKLKDANDPTEIYSYRKEKLDTAYWNNSQLLLDHPLNKAVIDGLNRYQPLQKQFKEMTDKK